MNPDRQSLAGAEQDPMIDRDERNRRLDRARALGGGLSLYRAAMLAGDQP